MTLPAPAARRDTALHAVPNGTVSLTPAEQLAQHWQQLVKDNASPNHPHRERPSETQVAVLRALHDRGGESWAGQLARDTGRLAGNISNWTLPGMVSVGVIAYGERVAMARGGVPAQLVHLTRDGRRILDLLGPAPRPRPITDEDEAA